MATFAKILFLCFNVIKWSNCSEVVQMSRSASIISDPSQASGIVYAAEGSQSLLIWRYSVPNISELSEISLAHNERHAVRFFRIKSGPYQVTNITAVYPPFPNDYFVNDLDDMSVGIRFPSANRSFAGNWTLSIVYSNIATPAARNTIIFYVAASPVNVRVQSTYRYPLVRSQLEIQCSATSNGLLSLSHFGKPLIFRWFHNGKALSSDLVPAPVLTDSQTWLSSLTINSVADAHAGGYSCQAEELGLVTVSSVVKITVIGFPTLLQRPFPAHVGGPMMLSCQPHVPSGLGVECNSLNVRLTCNGRQLHALTFPTLLPLYETNRLRARSEYTQGTSNTTLASVDFNFEGVTAELNAADCLCIVKYNRRSAKLVESVSSTNISTTQSALVIQNRSSELLTSIRLVVLFPPSDVVLTAEPPLPWLVPSTLDMIANKTSKHRFTVKCSVETMGNPKNLHFDWTSERPSPVPSQLTQPTAWSSVLDLTDSLQANIDNARLVQCQPSNDAGAGPLAQLRLSIYGSPSLTIKMVPSGQLIEPSQLVEYREGSSLSLQCLASVSGATPKPVHYIWRRDGFLLSADSPDLLISSVTSDDAGLYRCEVAIDTRTTSIGVLTAGVSFRLAVTFINVTVDALKPSEVIGEGDNVTLVCTADGYPLQGITFDSWLFEPGFSVPSSESLQATARQIPGSLNTQPLNDDLNVLSSAFHEEKAPIASLPEMILRLVNIQPSDSGKYWCSATNQMMLTKRRYYPIDVHFKPRLNAALSSPLTMPVRIGQSIVIVAALSSNPLPDEFEWVRLSGSSQRPEILPKSWVAERLSPTVGQLQIASLSASDLYDGPVTIGVRARNSRGQSMFRFMLVARGPPSDPTGLRVIRSWPNSILLSFLPGFDGGQPQLFQIVCSVLENQKSINKTVSETQPQVVVIRDPGFERLARVLIPNLSPATSYRCSVEGIVSRVENDSAVGSGTQMPWRTAKLYIDARTLSMPKINVSNVDWILTKPTFSPNTSQHHYRKRGEVYLLDKLCISVSCHTHPTECSTKGSKMVVEDRSRESSAHRSFSTNIAGMRLAAEINICLRRKIRTRQSSDHFVECWTSTTNHTLEVVEQNELNLTTVKSPVCLSRLPNETVNRAMSDSLPQFDSSISVSIRLFSIMDGDLVASVSNLVFEAPRRQSASGIRFFASDVDDDDYDDYGDVSESSIIAEGLLWPIVGSSLGIILLFSFVALVVTIACSAARRARKRAGANLRHRMSLSTTSTNNETRTAYVSPSSSTGNTGVASLNTSKSTNIMIVSHNGSIRQGGGVSSRDRLSNLTVSNSSVLAADRRRSVDASTASVSDFHWADFRANPLLASVGVATTLTSGVSVGSLRARRDERIITCVSGTNNAQIFTDGTTYAAATASLRKLGRANIGTVLECDPGSVDDPANFRSPTSSESFQCIDAFEAQQHNRRTSNIDTGSSNVEDNTSPPPRYTTLYSRLADIKPPTDRPAPTSTQLIQQTQYARLDFVKMAASTKSKPTQPPRPSRNEKTPSECPNDISSFH